MLSYGKLSANKSQGRAKASLSNMNEQLQKLHCQLSETVSDNETLIHVDFTEIYIGRLSNYVQSTHFGASQNQITLVTGAYYVR